MALEGANVLNASPVYNSQPSINLYAKLMQQNEIKRANEQKALQEQLGELKLDGLREADKPMFFEEYNKWKSLPSEIMKEKDSYRKMQLQSEFDKQFLKLQDTIGKSKEASKMETDFTGRLLDNRFRTQFTDDAVEKAQQNRKLSIYDPNYISDYSTLERQIDLSKVPDSITKVRNNLLKNAKEGNPVVGSEIRAGNRRGNAVVYKKSVPIEAQVFEVANLYDVDMGTKAYFQKKYSDLFDTLPEPQAKQQAITTELKSYQPLETVRQTAVFDNKESQSKGDGIVPLGNPSRQVFEGTMTQDGKTSTGGDIKKKSRIISDQFLTYDFGSVNFPQLSGVYNVKTGGTENIKSLDNAKVTGLGYFPYRGGEKRLMMSVVKDDREYLIPNEKIPQDVKNKKSYQAALARLGRPAQQIQQPATQNRTAPQGGYSNTRSIRDSKGNIIEAGVKNGKWYNTKTGKEIK